MAWRALSVVVVLTFTAAACGSSGGDEVRVVGGDNPAVESTTTVPQGQGDGPAVSDVLDPGDTGPSPNCATTLPSAELLASLPHPIDEVRDQLPVMHELYVDTVLVWDEFGIQPDHMMVDGLPRMLIWADDAGGRCEEILSAVARPDLVRFVDWTEEDYAKAFDTGGLPPWRQLIEADVGFTGDYAVDALLGISIGTGLYGVTGVTLRADQEDLAATLLDRYAELIEIRVGNFAYPPTQVDPATVDICGSLPNGTSPSGITISTPILRGDLNSGQFEVTISNDGTTTVHLVPSRIAELTMPDSSELVSTFTGFMTAEDRGSMRLEPGDEINVTATPATTSCSLDIGYSLPAGAYELVLPIYVFDTFASENDVSDAVLLPRLKIQLP